MKEYTIHRFSMNAQVNSVAVDLDNKTNLSDVESGHTHKSGVQPPGTTDMNPGKLAYF